MKKFNLNDYVKVKLTPRGVDIYFHRYDDTNEYILSHGGKPLERRMPRIDKDGFTEFQLWEFIQLYGNYIGPCNESVTTDIFLYLKDDDLKNVQ